MVEKIYDGLHYVASYFESGISVGAVRYFLIINPNTTILTDFMYAVSATGGIRLRFFESPTTTANGTALSLINQNRNILNTPQITIFRDPTVTADGTLLFDEQVGSATGPTKSAGGTSVERSEQEFVLKNNTKYLLRVDIQVNNSTLSTSFRWYER